MLGLFAIMGAVLVGSFSGIIIGAEESETSSEDDTLECTHSEPELQYGEETGDLLEQVFLELPIEMESNTEFALSQQDSAAIWGNCGDDMIIADENDQLIFSGSGNDMITAGSESANLFGGDGDDILSGTTVDEDQASGIVNHVGTGENVLFGGEGDDTLQAGGNDIAIGGSGSDTFILDGEHEADEVIEIRDFVPGEDKIIVSVPSSEDEISESWPSRPEFEGDVVIRECEQGLFEISINGTAIASVSSDSEVTESDIQVIHDYFEGPSKFEIEFGYTGNGH